MFVAREPHQLEPCPRAVTVGSFDGVHVGHRELIRRAARSGLRSTVVTFHPHPRLVVGKDVELITSLERRLDLLAAAGADDALVLEFTTEQARLAPEPWARQVLAPIGARRIVIGENFRFGYKRAGDAETLRRLGFVVVTVPLLFGASSSRIRQLVHAGALSEVKRYLGRPLELEGVVEPPALGVGHGDDTAGLERVTLRVDAHSIVPPPGVYEGRAFDAPARILVGADRQVELRVREIWPDMRGARVRVALDEMLARAAVRDRVWLQADRRRTASALALTAAAPA